MKKLRLPIADCRWPNHSGSARPVWIANGKPAIARGFTLIELLAVISILALLAALAVPALKNIGKSNAQVGASRQLLDDIARARQLAISQHTTVCMVFVPTNFWGGLANSNLYSAATTNLVEKQLTGYNFISYGKVGDQPGQHSWHYLSDWQALPEGSFIAPTKFQLQVYSLAIPQWQNDYAGQIDQAWKLPSGYVVNQIAGFAQTGIPFPTEASPRVWMPYLAFDHTGRLVSEVDAAGNYHHAYIPLAQGSVSYGMDANKHPTLTPVAATDITENPPGNSTNISYNVIDVDPLTGRAQLQHFRMQ